MRKTKIICTIGPATCDFMQLKKLADTGMNIVRLNMSHGTHEWHGNVIKATQRLNQKGYSLAVMLDTKGPEIRSGDLKKDISVKEKEEFIFTTRNQAEYSEKCTNVNYDGFTNDVKVGDVILVDGGLMSFKIKEIKDKDIICDCVDGGILTSRRHLNIVGKSAQLPSITEKDWEDINFGLKAGIDFIALSFVKDGKAITELKKYLKDGGHQVEVIAKVESADAAKNLEEITKATDGVMVARGDLGSELAVEEVPLLQDEMIRLCRKYNKPVIVATHLLESMITNPTPTRAEVTDIAFAVKSKADAIMLSGESAVGKYPNKAVRIMDVVAKRIEKELIQDNISVEKTDNPQIETVRAASTIADNLNAKSILVFTRSGKMAVLLSQFRSNVPVMAFTNTSHARRRLNLYWGITASRISFSSNPEKTIERAVAQLKEQKLIKKKDTIVIVSDLLVNDEYVNSVQIREV